MTLLCVYGLSAVVFQYGDLDFLHFTGLSGTRALCWFPPVLCFSVVCGLALDYDVFLVRAWDVYDVLVRQRRLDAVCRCIVCRS